MGAEVKSMEIKKTTPSTTTSTEQPLTKKKVRDFVEDMKSEITQVQWTSKDELITYAQIVVGMTFIFGIAIYITDLAIQGSLHTLNMLLRFIAG